MAKMHRTLTRMFRNSVKSVVFLLQHPQPLYASWKTGCPGWWEQESAQKQSTQYKGKGKSEKWSITTHLYKVGYLKLFTYLPYFHQDYISARSQHCSRQVVLAAFSENCYWRVANLSSLKVQKLLECTREGASAPSSNPRSSPLEYSVYRHCRQPKE